MPWFTEPAEATSSPKHVPHVAPVMRIFFHDHNPGTQLATPFVETGEIGVIHPPNFSNHFSNFGELMW